ncbi:MAG: MFS transporter, partial [Sedimentisphaerales bacterium]|nr:MFS transporter [Sedimentisphaerales bacterium]
MAISQTQVNTQTGIGVIFRSLQYRNYRLFFFGQMLSLIGTWTQQIALPWLVYRMTGSVFLLGVVGFAGQIPVFIVTPFAGVLTDRWNRYYILIVTQILLMVQAFLLTALFFSGRIQVWHVIVLMVFMGLINAFDMPTRQAFVIAMVDNREDLGNAIALNSMMFNSARLIGPSVAGLVIAATNEGICFLVNGISFVFVIASLLMMKINPQEPKSRKSHVLHEMKEGLVYMYGFMPLKYIILLLALVSLVGMPYTVLMPVFAGKILGGGPHTFGFLMTAAGIGALAGAIYLASRKSVWGLERILPMATAVFGFGLIAFSLSRQLWLSLPLMLITGLGMIIQIAACNTLIQTMVEDDKRGRVMSLYVMAFIGTAPFGSLLAGTMATHIGAPKTLMIGGVFCVAGAMLFARKLPQLRHSMRP